MPSEPHVSFCPQVSLVYEEGVFPDTDLVQDVLHAFSILRFHMETLGRVIWEFCSFIPHCFSWSLGTVGAECCALKNQEG
jgi:hypothetical protein